MGGLIAEGWLSTNHFVDQNAWGAGFPAEVDILWFFTTAFIHPSWFPIWGLWVEVLLKYYGRGEGKMGWKWVEATKKVEDWYMCIYIYITNILANALPRKLWKSNDRWFEEWLNFAQKNRWWCFALDLMLVWFPAPYKSFLEVSIYLISKVRHESLLKSSVAQEENDSFGNKKNMSLSECWWTEKCFLCTLTWKFDIQDPRPKANKMPHWGHFFFPSWGSHGKNPHFLSSPLSWRYLSSTEPWFVGLSESSGRNFTRRISSFYNPSQHQLYTSFQLPNRKY